MNCSIRNIILCSACLVILCVSAVYSETSLQYLFPLTGSSGLPADTPLLVRFNDLQPQMITNRDTFIWLQGSFSGRISGKSILSDDRKTWIFQPFHPLKPGEIVTVHLNPADKNGKSLLQIQSTFSIEEESGPELHELKDRESSVMMKITLKSSGYPTNTDGVTVLNGVSVPSDFPFIHITVSDNPASEAIFCSNENWQGNPMYSLILDNTGAPVWYWRHHENRRDLKVQNGLLTMQIRGGKGGGTHIALDTAYTVVDTFYSPPGFSVNEHELQLRPDGHYLMIGNSERTFDLSKIIPGGEKDALIIENNLIEMDSNDNPVFIWRCWDHYDIRDVINEALTQRRTDYVHMNSIDIAPDGHYIISSRHLSEITKINSATGEIIWRLGGVHNEFNWLNDTDRISYQHDARILPNGHLTLFDNGTQHSPQYSRALELEIDTRLMTVRKVWEFRDSPDKYSWFMGNVQRLENGNTLINYADDSLPKLTEVRPDGTKAFEMNFENPAYCYRVFRFPWKGNAKIPYLLSDLKSSRLILIFNKFGDRDVTHYEVYGGNQSRPETMLAETENPYLVLTESDLENGQTYFFRVKAVNSAGKQSDFSNEIQADIHFVTAGENLLSNGDFSAGLQAWTFEVKGNASADVNTAEEELAFEINNPGGDIAEIQLRQEGFELIHGETYRFEFDAKADQGRTLEAEVGQTSGAFINYSKIGLTYVRSRNEHFSYSFKMDEATDPYCSVIFNAGAELSGITIDNVSLILLESSKAAAVSECTFPDRFKLGKAFPNPSNGSAQIGYELPRKEKVALAVYDLLGRRMDVLLNEVQNPGKYQIRFDTAEYDSGIYFYMITTSSFSGSGKLIVIK